MIVDRASFEQYEARRMQLRLALADLERGSIAPGPDPGSERSGPEELMGWIVEHAQALVSFDLTN